VFEARYLDLIAACLRDGTGFGVVCLSRGHEVRRTAEEVAFEAVGTGGRNPRCRQHAGGHPAGPLSRHRFASRSRRAASRRTGSGSPRQRRSRTTPRSCRLPHSSRPRAAWPTPSPRSKVRASNPFLPPHRFDDAGWVANRWCEILPIPIAAKQKLMALPDPLLRLEVVDDILRRKANS
jgi:hypothetical protein